MGLEFKDKAIVLSGVAGTRLKTSILGNYYEFWHSVQSGGGKNYFRYPTSIIDLDAGTGLIYIKDEDEIIKGSAGHALDLKFLTPNIGTNNLTVFLIEEHNQCRQYLIENMKEIWGMTLHSRNDLGYPVLVYGNVWLFESQEDFLKFTGSGTMIERGLFLFDPLLAPEYSMIEKVAKHRIVVPFQMRTEFLLFFFTSDWILGRKNFAPLPQDTDDNNWSPSEKESARQATAVFGDRSWLSATTSGQNSDTMQSALLELYRKKMMKWFRLVMAIPFQPKPKQIYHLLCCSNYEVGMNRIISEWAHLVSMHRGVRIRSGVTDHGNTIFPRFKRVHPELQPPPRKRRPLEWQILWKITKDFVYGTADSRCKSLVDLNGPPIDLEMFLEWLSEKKYLEVIEDIPWAWKNDEKIPRYHVNYEVLYNEFDLAPLVTMEPLTADALAFCRGNQEETFLSKESIGNLIEIRMRCPPTKCRDVISTTNPIEIPTRETEFLICNNSDCSQKYKINWIISETGLALRIEGTPSTQPFYFRVIEE